MHVRLGQREDAQRLAALAIQVWLHTYATEGVSSTIASYVLSEFTAEKFASRLVEKSTAVFVAEIDAGLIGYALCDPNASCPVTSNAKVELSTLYVQEHFIARGLGSSLLRTGRVLGQATIR